MSEQELGGESPAEEAAPPHALSMVAWDVPSPAIVGRPASVKVGVQCEHGCDLQGRAFIVRAAAGVVVAAAELDRAPAEETPALCWTEVALPTPVATGVSAFTAQSPALDTEPPHAAATAAFSFRVDPLPEHQVTVRVVSEATGEAVERLEVRMNHYAAYTDAEGLARFDLPGGAYTCSIRKLGYKAEPVAVDVTADLSLDVMAGKGETREELEARLSAWENYPWT